MNQIPNIEETHDTRKVEEIVKEFAERNDCIMCYGKDQKQMDRLRTTLHHQLQKAREGCICKDNGVIELLEEQNKEARQKIASLYLPAHEVNHGEDCIECKEIAAYNAALQDAIKALTSKK